MRSNAQQLSKIEQCDLSAAAENCRVPETIHRIAIPLETTKHNSLCSSGNGVAYYASA
jgi:hypothetical protein